MSKANMDYLNAKMAAFPPGGVPPDPEVLKRRGRRGFTAGYKAEVVRQALACREQGEIGASMRRILEQLLLSLRDQRRL